MAHYLEALEWQKEMVKVHTIFGGKNPHPNYLVGGAPCSINLDESNAINAERLAMVGRLFDEAEEFVEKVYLPDLMAVASFYKDWGAIGGGLPNYLAYGDLPTHGYGDPTKFKFPRGAILEPQPRRGPAGGRQGRDAGRGVHRALLVRVRRRRRRRKHPWEGETKLKYTGPKPPYEQLDVQQKYSWLKTPRWKGHPMEVGPLARLLVAYASGHAGGEGGRRRRAEAARGAGRRALLDARAHGGTRSRDEARRALGEGVLRPAPREHQERRHAHGRPREVASRDVAGRGAGRRA